MISIYIDGVLQAPGIDYMATQNAVSFTQPPLQGSYIEVNTLNSTVARLMGDGRTHVFQLDGGAVVRHEMLRLLDDVCRYRDNPAVAEALEKLKVVIELVKE